MESRGRRIRNSCEPRNALVVVSLLSLVFMLVLHRPFSSRSQPAEPLPMDVVGIAVKPTCVNQESVDALNKYLKPRTIHVITAGLQSCTAFTNMAPNIICHDESHFVPGVSKQTVADHIQARLQRSGDKEYRGRSLAGWYLQQFLKLGAARAIPSLSDHFLIWDLDMILLNPLTVMKYSKGRVQTVVNVGGARRIPGYQLAYQRLTNKSLEFAPDGTSFVTHWMVMYKPYVEELLQAFTPPGAPASSNAWVWRILDAVPEQFVNLGFSEYASYVSWVMQHHPESQHILSKRTWTRMPFGVNMVRLMQRMHPKRCCCPSRVLLTALKLMGYQYTGYEAGHIPQCGYTRMEFKSEYCLAAR